MILLFLLFLGEVLRLIHDNCASHSPSNREKKGGGVRLFGTVRLIGRICYVLASRVGRCHLDTQSLKIKTLGHTHFIIFFFFGGGGGGGFQANDFEIFTSM